jgi:site-specific DNA-methyltransferase (adenine-specific)
VVRINRVPASQLKHPYQKPIGLLNVICGASCLEGQTVLDPYMGSGSTGVACVRAGISFIGCEIDHDYFAIAQKRIKEAGMPLFDVLGEAS